MSKSERTEFVFLWWDECDSGVFLAKEYCELLNRFLLARKATTWGKFLEMLGPFSNFILESTQCDDYQPRYEERIEDIENSVWMLYDQEFHSCNV